MIIDTHAFAALIASISFSTKMASCVSVSTSSLGNDDDDDDDDDDDG